VVFTYADAVVAGNAPRSVDRAVAQIDALGFATAQAIAAFGASGFVDGDAKGCEL